MITSTKNSHGCKYHYRWTYYILYRPVIELLMFPVVQKSASETTSRIGPKGLGLCLGRAALIGFAHNTILGAGEGARRAEIRELLIIGFGELLICTRYREEQLIWRPGDVGGNVCVEGRVHAERVWKWGILCGCCAGANAGPPKSPMLFPGS